jgi:hypothetical protein
VKKESQTGSLVIPCHIIFPIHEKGISHSLQKFLNLMKCNQNWYFQCISYWIANMKSQPKLRYTCSIVVVTIKIIQIFLVNGGVVHGYGLESLTFGVNGGE